MKKEKKFNLKNIPTEENVTSASVGIDYINTLFFKTGLVEFYFPN